MFQQVTGMAFESWPHPPPPPPPPFPPTSHNAANENGHGDEDEDISCIEIRTFVETMDVKL